ncbi:phage tail tube protein [Akkermansia muciniphila]|uniref:phage tail tube protein n=1 Tax=Akkermansia muciniphila TaxID=239935 RepID=UPI001387556A|nr:phage tail tube protein [Akkermansia muciniphila]
MDVCEDVSAEPVKWRKLYGLNEVPDVGGDAEKIDVTNLEDKNKRSIDGIVDYGELEFKFYLNKETKSDTADSAQIMESYAVLRAMQLAGKTPNFRLVYPDGTGHQWQGSVNVIRSGVGVNAALAFTLKTSIMSEMQDIEVTE